MDPTPFERAARALGRLADGKELQKRLSEAAEKALEPVRDRARSNIMGMRSAGLNKSGSPLRRAAAQQTIVETVEHGPNVGARVRAKNRPMPRNFRTAPKRLDSAKGFRHPVFGKREVWVSQRGRPGWFSDPVKESTGRITAAVNAVMQDMANRVAQDME